jgi:hypothetical protein
MGSGQQEFKILSYSTDKDNYNFKKLSESLEIEVLPVLLPWTSDFYPKSVSVYETIKNLNKDTIILVCDAYDVLPINGATNEKLFNQIKESFDLNKITFNSEKNCYPNTSLLPLNPYVNSNWKYLNGGIYVGRVKNILNMLETLLPNMKGIIDQEVFSNSYIKGEFNIDIDHQCKVFQTLYQLDPNDLKFEDEIITNNLTNTKPLLVHGNGGSDLSKFLK